MKNYSTIIFLALTLLAFFSINNYAFAVNILELFPREKTNFETGLDSWKMWILLIESLLAVAAATAFFKEDLHFEVLTQNKFGLAKIFTGLFFILALIFIVLYNAGEAAKAFNKI
jgi:hypothetical protein